MLYLASRSPRRNQLLTRLGVPFQVLDAEVPELRADGEQPLDYVRRVALDKARAGLALVADDPHALVLSADTEVVLDDRVFGKPVDADDARAMLGTLSGRTHEVMTAVVLLGHASQAETLVVTQVSVSDLDPAWIAAYVDSGEPMGKAGAYAIQGAGECLVHRLEGSYSAVVGLPLQQTWALLAAAGLQPSPFTTAGSAAHV